MESSKALSMNVNTNIDNLRSEDRFILACLQHQQSLPELDLDEDLLMHRMSYHRVTSMVYHHLLKIEGLHVLSAEMQAQLKENYYQNISRNLAISYLVKQIGKTLGAHDIEAIALKGAMLLQAFPDYTLVREMSDLDILVKSKKLNQSLEVLSTIGYYDALDFLKWKNDRKKWYLKKISNAIPIQNIRSDSLNIIIEIHWQLFSVFNHTAWLEKELWNRAKYCSEQNVYHLDPIDTLLHLCAHQCNDLQIYLYGLVDVANILRYWKEELDWVEVIRRAKSQRLLLHLVNILRLSHELLNTPLPDVYFSYLKSYEGKASPGYYFLLERLFQKEMSEDEPDVLSIVKVFRRLEYSNLGQHLWRKLKLLLPQSVYLRLNYHIGRHFYKKD